MPCSTSDQGTLYLPSVTEIKAWMNNYDDVSLLDVITYQWRLPWPNLNSGIAHYSWQRKLCCWIWVKKSNKEIYLHFLLFKIIEADQQVEIIAGGRQRPGYHVLSFPWMLMSWWRKCKASHIIDFVILRIFDSSINLQLQIYLYRGMHWYITDLQWHCYLKYLTTYPPLPVW